MLIDGVMIIAILVGLTEFVKKYLPAKYVPLVPFVAGIIAGIVFADGDMASKIVVGLGYGLSSMGLFDMTKVKTKSK